MPSHQPTPNPTHTPTPAPTPEQFRFFFPTYTPTPEAVETLTPEEKFWNGWRWDHERGKNTLEVQIETGKKKKKKKTPVPDHVDENGILQDSNEDGIVEFSIPVLYHLGEKVSQDVWYTAFIHICCQCALTHRVYINFYFGPLGFRMWQRWEVLEEETHLNRVRKWGPNYRQRMRGYEHPHLFGSDPTGLYFPDPIGPYSAERQ